MIQMVIQQQDEINTLMSISEQKITKAKQLTKKSKQQGNDEATFKRFSPVWGKIKGYPWWPAKILDINLDRPKHYTVIFYSDSSIAYLNQSQIRPYENQPQKVVPSDPKIFSDWRKAKQQFNQLLKEARKQQDRQQSYQTDQQNKEKEVIQISATQRNLSEQQVFSAHQSKKSAKAGKKQEKQKINDEIKMKKNEQVCKTPNFVQKKSSIMPQTAYSFIFAPEQKRIVNEVSNEEQYELKLLNKRKKGEKIEINSSKWDRYYLLKQKCLKLLLTKEISRKKAIKILVKIWTNLVQRDRKDELEIADILKNKSESQIKQMIK